jgi:hypothetical protein
MHGASATAAVHSSASPLVLECLGGEPAPPALAADLSLLARLPAEALQKLWQVLTPSLAEPLTKQAEETLDLFCGAFRIDADLLGRVVKACRFVIREAALRDLPAPALGRDLEALCPGDHLVKELLLVGYEPARANVRLGATKSAVADHGKLLTGMKWRLDSVRASEQAPSLATPVAIMTFQYLKGTETGRVTFQVLPDMLGELRAACDKMLGDPGRGEKR